jgi:hypothetical protein
MEMLRDQECTQISALHPSRELGSTRALGLFAGQGACISARGGMEWNGVESLVNWRSGKNREVGAALRRGVGHG